MPPSPVSSCYNLTRSKGYACRVGVKMLIASFETGMEGVEGYVTARGRIGHRGLPCYESESSGLTTNAGERADYSGARNGAASTYRCLSSRANCPS